LENRRNCRHKIKTPGVEQKKTRGGWGELKTHRGKNDGKQKKTGDATNGGGKSVGLRKDDLMRNKRANEFEKKSSGKIKRSTNSDMVDTSR